MNRPAHDIIPPRLVIIAIVLGLQHRLARRLARILLIRAHAVLLRGLAQRRDEVVLHDGGVRRGVRRAADGDEVGVGLQVGDPGVVGRDGARGVEAPECDLLPQKNI